MSVDLLVIGHVISRVAFDHAVTLLTDEDAEFRIETDFTLKEGSSSVSVDPPDAADYAATLVRLLGRPINLAHVSDTGLLDLQIDGAVTIQVGPNADFEAWAFSGPADQKVVCVPGGGTATWGIAM